jgi:hypothetical protein
MAGNETSMDKQIRVMKISMIPLFVAVFATGFYFLYLETIGIEISTWLFFTSIVWVTFLGAVICLTLNEAILKIWCSERFNFKRLVFRWMIPTMYCSLIWVASVLMSLIIPFVETFFQLFFGTLLATAIFVIIILRFRHLFSQLDKGDWHWNEP